jgi:hypothetical protein
MEAALGCPHRSGGFSANTPNTVPGDLTDTRIPGWNATVFSPKGVIMKFDKNNTAVVMIDPQNEVLSETGLGWPLLRDSLHENNTVENMERIFKAAREFGFEVFISPHYFYPSDKGWKFNGPLENDEAASGMFSRKAKES